MPRYPPILTNCSVRTGHWIGDAFIYTTTTSNRLNYLVGDQTYTLTHFDAPHYILGYLPRDARIYVADKDLRVTSFALSLAVVEYQTLVLRGDLDAANEILPDIPDAEKAKIARFLEGQGYKEEALEVATDSEHRFELALGLNKLDIALELAKEKDSEHKWKTVGDAALTAWNVELAAQCFKNAKDLGSLLLLYSASSDPQGLRSLVDLAKDATQNNIAFSALWQLADIDGCIDLLLETDRTSEAVLFTQTYKPSRLPAVVKLWKEGLEKKGKTKISRTLGVPPVDGEGDADMFPGWEEWLEAEKTGGPAKLVDVDEAGDDDDDDVDAEGELEEDEEEEEEEDE